MLKGKALKILGAIGVATMISTVSVSATIAWCGKADLDAVYELTKEYVQKQQGNQAIISDLQKQIEEKDNTINELTKKVEDYERREEEVMEELAKDRLELEKGKVDLDQANRDVKQFRKDMEELLKAEE